MTGTMRGPYPIQTESKSCEHCGTSYNRKRFDSKLEDIRIYKNRRYCSRPCADESRKSRARVHYEEHKEEMRDKKKKKMKQLRDNNPEKYNAQSRAAKAKERAALFEMYGHACSGCGFTDKRALTLDHKLNNGSQERKKFGERGVYRRALEMCRPDEYQTLCMNCQFIKRVRIDAPADPIVAATAWRILA